MHTIDSFKRSFLTDVFDYIAAIHPNTPNILERLKISYQLSNSLRDKSSKFHDYAESLPISQLNSPIY